MSRILTNEEPKTAFMDEELNVKVSLISYPDPILAEKMFINTCYGHSNSNSYDNMTAEQRNIALQTIISEGTLPKGLEMLGKFVFLIENISLTITHMLCRHRFFTILQRSTAVDDLRNENFCMPKSFAKNEEFYKRIKRWYYLGKQLFCDGVDKYGLSVQNARLFIPKNNCNHMFIGTDFKNLLEVYGQRKDTQEEPIVSNIIVEKMKFLICEKFPYLETMFKSNCETGRCLHTKSGSECNIVFKRNAQHRKFLSKEYNPDKQDNLLHDKTRDEMNKGPVINTEYYIGPNKVTNEEWSEGKIKKSIVIDPALQNKNNNDNK